MAHLEKLVNVFLLQDTRPHENRHLPADFYEKLRQQYDERFYRQEVLGEYLNVFSGRAYWAFDRQVNVRELEYDPELPLCWALDFNIDPMCSLLAQVRDGKLFVLDELVLPHASTWEACEEFLGRLERLRGPGRQITVYVYGDAAGRNKQTAAGRTDYRIIEEFLGLHRDKAKYHLRVPLANPAVKDRVNAVNAMLRNSAGQVRLLVAPRCRELMLDLEQVSWKTDPHGNVLAVLDKSDPRRTHLTDALGYLVDYEFGLRPAGGPRAVNLGVTL